MIGKLPKSQRPPSPNPFTTKRRHLKVQAIPTTWTLTPVVPFALSKWVATINPIEMVSSLFQMHSPGFGALFIQVKANFFKRASAPVQDIRFLILYRARVVIPCDEVRTTSINSNTEFSGGIWCMGVTSRLPFNSLKQILDKAGPIKEQPLYNYSIQKGYQIVLFNKPRRRRLLEQTKLNFLEEELTCAIELHWNPSKPTKLLIFLWQCNFNGLPTGPWARVVGFAVECRSCLVGFDKMLKHLFSNCRFVG